MDLLKKSAEQKSVLVIDDEQEFTLVVKMRLQATGKFSVLQAFDGRKGINLARRHVPDLILLDVKMPKMDGIEVLKALKDDARTSAIPVIMVTAVDDDMTKFRAQQSYDEGYVTKPVRLDELQKKVEETLARVPS